MIPLPPSPEDAVNVTPETLKWLSELDSVENSPPPQLMETWWTPIWLAAKSTAPNRLVKLLVADSTSKIFAPGAMAWTHSTSSEISSAQPLLVRGGPCGVSLVKQPLAVVQLGRANCELNVPRSLSMPGSSKASIMATVWPVPQRLVLPKVPLKEQDNRSKP